MYKLVPPSVATDFFSNVFAAIASQKKVFAEQNLIKPGRRTPFELDGDGFNCRVMLSADESGLPCLVDSIEIQFVKDGDPFFMTASMYLGSHGPGTERSSFRFSIITSSYEIDSQVTTKDGLEGINITELVLRYEDEPKDQTVKPFTIDASYSNRGQVDRLNKVEIVHGYKRLPVSVISVLTFHRVIDSDVEFTLTSTHDSNSGQVMFNSASGTSKVVKSEAVNALDIFDLERQESGDFLVSVAYPGSESFPFKVLVPNEISQEELLNTKIMIEAYIGLCLGVIDLAREVIFDASEKEVDANE